MPLGVIASGQRQSARHQVEKGVDWAGVGERGERHARAGLPGLGRSLDSLKLEDVEPPVPKAGEVLIRVKATAVNYADAIMVAGRYQTKPELPFSPGLETAGVIKACGPDVEGLKPGDRVMAILAYGGLAEYAVAPAAETYVILQNLSFAEAGAFPIAYISSHVALRWQGRLEPGETLLVLGAAGGVGLTAVEIGKAWAPASSPPPARREAGRGHGARRRRHGELRQREADRAGDGVDRRQGLRMCASIPSAGGCSMRRCPRWVGAGASCCVGNLGGMPRIPANRLLVKHRAALVRRCAISAVTRPRSWNARSLELLAGTAKARLKPLISARYPLEGAVEALGGWPIGAPSARWWSVWPGTALDRHREAGDAESTAADGPHGGACGPRRAGSRGPWGRALARST